MLRVIEWLICLWIALILTALYIMSTDSISYPGLYYFAMFVILSILASCWYLIRIVVVVNARDKRRS